MREILFRGQTYQNKWIYGCLAVGKDRDWASILPLETIDNPPNMFGEIEVEPETVGQYTGLKDKNGTKIFEGDIIRTYHGNGLVVYSQQYALFGYIMIEKDNIEKEYDYRFTDVVIEDGIEVIGNIYDNPELLKV